MTTMSSFFHILLPYKKVELKKNYKKKNNFFLTFLSSLDNFIY